MGAICGDDGIWVYRSEPSDGLTRFAVSGAVFRASQDLLNELRATPGAADGSHFTLSQRAAASVSNRMLAAAGLESLPVEPVGGRDLPSMDWSKVCAVREGVTVSLRPYQQEGCQWLANRGLHGILGDEMGLGKTVQVAVTLEAARPVRRRTLVVTTKSTLYNWPVELGWWAPSWRAVAVPDTRSLKKAIASGADVLVLTWGLISRLRGQLADWCPDTIIVDEAQYAKEGYKTDRGKALAALSGQARSILLMTGTPLMNRPAELWFLFHLLEPEAYATFLPFAERFCAPSEVQVRTRNGIRSYMDYSGSNNQDELAQRLSCVQLRRKKAEVLTDLPPRHESTVYTQVSSKLRTAWREALSAMSSSEVRDAQILQQFLAVYRQVGVEKVEAVVDLVSTILSSGDGPAIVLIRNTDVHKALEEALSEVRVCSITGSTPGTSRIEIVRSFQAGAYDVLIGSEAVREGVTLTRARHVIQAQYWWTESAMDQGHSRAHRFGQERPVLVHYVHAKGTIDDHIVRAVQRKKQLREGIVEAAVEISLLDLIREDLRNDPQ
jgi:SNF2 family DNA or RNA helicase